MTVDLRHIAYFLAVAEEQNFTRAAERVGIQQPPLSRQIRDMEESIGAALFRRTRKGAELTEAGAAFHEAVRHVPDQVAHAITEARRAARGEVGVLRLGYTTSAGFNPVVAQAIRSFRSQYPDVDLTLIEANTPQLVQGIHAGTYDLVFLRPGMAGGEALRERVLSQEQMLAVLPADHPAGAQGSVDLADLREEPFILLSQAAGPILLDEIFQACRSAGFTPRIGQTVSQITSAINLVANGMGVSVVPASMRFLQVPGVAYLGITGHAPLARLAVAHRRGETGPQVRNFLAGCA